MKKTIVKILVIFAAICCTAFVFTACDTNGSGNVKNVHGHEIIEKEIIDKEPTCTTAGVKYIVCATCGELLRTIITEPTGHSYKSEYVFDDNYHWQETTCGHTDAIIKRAHTFNEDEICTVCGYDNKVTLSLKYVAINNGTEYAVDDLTDNTVKAVYIPDTYNGLPVTKINEMVFYKNTAIEKVIMGDNITDIGASAFYECTNLKTVKLSENLAEIKENAFYNCRSLTSINIPDRETCLWGIIKTNQNQINTSAMTASSF